VVAALVLLGSGYKLALLRAAGTDDVFMEARPGAPEMSSGDIAGQEQAKQEEKIVVHVVGAVKKPGVYKLPAGSRVVDAVNIAVPAPNARLDLLNLAAPLLDGRQVVVFSEEDYQEYLAAGSPGKVGAAPGSLPSALPGPASLPPALGTTGSGLVNINTAGQAELETLPGIGPALAGRIIEYRDSNGAFLSLEDIKNVSGIGEKKFEQLKDKITV